MVTFENGKNCFIWFEISNSWPIFDSIGFKVKKNTICLALDCAMEVSQLKLFDVLLFVVHSKATLHSVGHDSISDVS